MSRYLRLLVIFWRAAFSTELEYRVDAAANAVLSLFSVVWAAVGVSVYFQFTDAVAGWTYRSCSSSSACSSPSTACGRRSSSPTSRG